MKVSLPKGMKTTQSSSAQEVLVELNLLQLRFRDGLNKLAKTLNDDSSSGDLLTHSSWLRDEGVHGGGWRWGTNNQKMINRCSLNISSVHYDDLPAKRLASATALSCIVHPNLPGAPSLHTHISWTEMKDGQGGGWRLMADLNPSTPFTQDQDAFTSAIDESLSVLPPQWLTYAKAQGDRYFTIPALNRHRGVAHYYLEQWKSEDPQQDLQLALQFGRTVIDTYLNILSTAFQEPREEATKQKQLDYHSTYFLQVLTLDRGTSSGLLVHNQNDVGIMGSLPQRVSRSLLSSWVKLQPKPQDVLLQKLISVLPQGEICEIDDQTRLALASVVRTHYQEHPEALALQARGDILPPTVANHHSETDQSPRL